MKWCHKHCRLCVCKMCNHLVCILLVKIRISLQPDLNQPIPNSKLTVISIAIISNAAVSGRICHGWKCVAEQGRNNAYANSKEFVVFHLGVIEELGLWLCKFIFCPLNHQIFNPKMRNTPIGIGLL